MKNGTPPPTDLGDPIDFGLHHDKVYFLVYWGILLDTFLILSISANGEISRTSKDLSSLKL